MLATLILASAFSLARADLPPPASAPTTAAKPQVTEVVIHVGSSLYFNHEYGLLYANTGAVPAHMKLICTEAGKEFECGSIPAHVQLVSYGLSAYWLNYTRKNPLAFHVNVDPHEAMVGDVVGSYIGGKAGAGLGLGARGIVLFNTESGVIMTSGQDDLSFDMGLDLSVPNVDISVDGGVDLSRPLASFVTDLSS